MLLLKYLEEIKKILVELGCKPNKFSSKYGNRYMVCGNIIVVEAKIIGISYLKYVKYGYFLISADDEKLLHDKKYIIFTGPSKNFNVGVKSSHSAQLFKSALLETYPFKNNKSKYYAYINNNPLDMRRSNLEESINRKKRWDNKSGRIGVYFDRIGRRWIATLTINRKQRQKYFSISKYGDKAMEMAVNTRDKWEVELE